MRNFPLKVLEDKQLDGALKCTLHSKVLDSLSLDLTNRSDASSASGTYSALAEVSSLRMCTHAKDATTHIRKPSRV